MVDRVETEHPNGVTQGPWTITAICHNERVNYRLDELAVEKLLRGDSKPVPLMVFTDLAPIRPASRTEIRYLEKAGLFNSERERQELETGFCTTGFDISVMGYVCSGCGSVYARQHEGNRPCPGRQFRLKCPEPKQLL